MRKAISLTLVLVLILSLSLLAGCSGGGSYTAPSGKYTITALEEDGEDIISEIMASGLINAEDLYMDFQSGGKGVMSMMGEEESFTFKMTGENKISMTSDGDDIIGTISGDKITFEEDGSKMVLEKQ